MCLKAQQCHQTEGWQTHTGHASKMWGVVVAGNYVRRLPCCILVFVTWYRSPDIWYIPVYEIGCVSETRCSLNQLAITTLCNRVKGGIVVRRRVMRVRPFPMTGMSLNSLELQGGEQGQASGTEDAVEQHV